MAFRSSYIRELQEEEARCLGKLDKLARRKMAANPRLSYSSALGEATSEFRATYRHYTEARAQLSALGVRPALLPGLRLGRGQA